MKNTYILRDAKNKQVAVPFTSWTAAEKFAINYITNKDNGTWLFLEENGKPFKQYFWDTTSKKVAKKWFGATQIEF